MRHRQSTRLRAFDYGSKGFYFVTILIKDRYCLLGEIVDNQHKGALQCVVQLNVIGEIVKQAWLNTPKVRANVQVHEYIIMPNHIHGILEITENKNILQPTNTFQSPSHTLGAIIRGIKIAIIKRLKELNIGNDFPILKEWDYKIWHRNYHDHIIRNTEAYNNIVNYIADNPRRWLEKLKE